MIQNGEYGDPELQQVARRTEEGAKRWCNENRKLENGNPIQWVPECRSGQVIHGTTTVTVQAQAPGKKPYSMRIKRTYYLERLSVKD